MVLGGLIDLVDGQHELHDLFNLTPNNPKLMNVYDTLNNRFGSDAIFLTAQGITQNEQCGVKCCLPNTPPVGKIYHKSNVNSVNYALPNTELAWFCPKTCLGINSGFVNQRFFPFNSSYSIMIISRKISL